MIRGSSLVCALLALPGFATTTAGAEPPLAEEAMETTTFESPVPTRVDGSMSVRTCPSCQPVLMPLTPATRFQVGTAEVSLAEFNNFVRGSERMLVVLYDPRSRTITGLAVQGEMPRRSRR